MPYASNADLPPAVKKLPEKKQTQWRKVWTDVYNRTGDEKKAFAEAWAAVKKFEDLVQILKVLKPGEKVDKVTVAYFPPELNRNDFTCKGCALYREDGKCTVLSPSDISPDWGCELYTPGANASKDTALLEAVPGKLVGLSKGPFTCGRCTHFGESAGDCEIVKGAIEGKACCNAWEKEKPGKKESEVEMLKDKQAARGDKVALIFPIMKYDEEKREVVGIATGEVVDSHGEILAYAGSKEALKMWAGNVREMHQPKAVGRKVSMEFDDSTKTITVKSRVSKGAQDTWEKVLDGTLAAYSVGGIRIDSEIKAAKDLPEECLKGAPDVPEEILYTTKWRMNELSLVDAGANPLSAISLVKEIDGSAVATEVLDDPENAVEKKPLSYAERQNLPKSSFAYVDAKGKGHYPIKNKDGECDAAHVRNALSRAAQAIKRGGASAEIARKAMPKIRACAKKLKIGQFRDDPASVMLFYNVKKIRLEDGTEYVSETGLDSETLLGAAEMMKWPGGYAMEFSAEPVDFMTAYERYQKDEALQEVYDILQILNSCLTAIAFDQEMTDDEKKKLVAESVDQFVSIFVGAASDAAAKIDLEGDLRKRIEEIIMGVEDKKNEQPVLSAEAVAAMLKTALSAETLGSALAKSIQPIVENQTKLEKTLTESLASITERLEKVEKQPATPANAPALKVIAKDGRTSALDRVRPANEAGTGTALRQNENNELVLEENGIEYTLPSVIKDIAALEKTLESQPPNDPLRLRNEVKAIALHRVRKILSGDKVWR